MFFGGATYEKARQITGFSTNGCAKPTGFSGSAGFWRVGAWMPSARFGLSGRYCFENPNRKARTGSCRVWPFRKILFGFRKPLSVLAQNFGNDAVSCYIWWKAWWFDIPGQNHCGCGVGKDPELRQLEGGVPVTECSLATTDTYKDVQTRTFRQDFGFPENIRIFYVSAQTCAYSGVVCNSVSYAKRIWNSKPITPCPPYFAAKHPLVGSFGLQINFKTASLLCGLSMYLHL